jgi:CBS domain containing-hemolysin-like protein
LPAQAQHLLQGETLDAAANVLALVVIFVVPIVGIAVFWIVHVLPEKIAHKNHHPQRDAIHMLCLLSLVFGGILWPLAWLWAYSKPVLYKMAYGRDKHDDFYDEAEAEPGAPQGLQSDLAKLRGSVERMLEKGAKPEELRAIRDQLAALEPRIAAAPAAQAALAAPVKEPH